MWVFYYFQIYLNNMGWIQIRNFCLDPDPELRKFKAGSGINLSGSTTLETTTEDSRQQRGFSGTFALFQ